jgi:hypothetical protein
MQNERVYIIYSPFLDQACALAKFLCAFRPGAIVWGALMPEEEHNLLSIRKYLIRKYFSKILKLEDALKLDINNYVHVPTGAISTKYFLENFGDIKLGQITLTRKALQVFDKMWLINIAKSIGIPVPETWENLESVQKYPVFYKKRFETGGGKRGIILTEKDAKLKFDSIKTNGDIYIYQEFIKSRGTYGVAFIADQGKILANFVYFERESFPPMGGSAVIIEKFQDKKLVEYSKKLIEALEYSGWGLVEFKYDPDRCDYVLMEVNAKFWASCEFTFLNEPKFLKLLFGINMSKKPVKRMVFIHRAFERGMPFFFENIRYIVNSNLKLYPGWWLPMLSRVIPLKAKLKLSKIIKKLQRKFAKANVRESM